METQIVTSNLNRTSSSCGYAIDEYEYLHVSQLSSWDCGVACCAMVMKWYGIDTTDVYSCSGCRLLTRQSPLWTIELFIFLLDLNAQTQSDSNNIWNKRVEINGTFYTKCAGIHPDHRQIEWYKQLNTDEKIISKAFREAKSKRYPIAEEELSLDDLKYAIQSRNSIAIILVNSLALNQHKNQQQRIEIPNYTGHYIVLVSYDSFSDEFIYLNPSHPSNCTGNSSIL